LRKTEEVKYLFFFNDFRVILSHSKKGMKHLSEDLKTNTVKPV